MKFRPFKCIAAHSITLLFCICFLTGSCSRSQKTDPPQSVDYAVSQDAVDINTATERELESLPYIGPAIANRIVEFREKNGRFRRPEHLMLVLGISEKRFRQIRAQIRTE